MIQTKHIRTTVYQGVIGTEIIHWGRVIAIFPEITPDQLFAKTWRAEEFFQIIETIYARERIEVLKNEKYGK